MAFKCLQNFLRQRGVEVIGHDELPSGQTDGAQLRQRRGRQDGEQAGGFFGQAFRAFRQNVSVVNFDFKGQKTNGPKLCPQPAARKRRCAARGEWKFFDVASSRFRRYIYIHNESYR